MHKYNKLINILIVVVVLIAMLAIFSYISNLFSYNSNPPPPSSPPKINKSDKSNKSNKSDKVDDVTESLSKLSIKSSKTKTLSKGEEVCKKFMEEYYGKKFHNVRLKCLINPKTKRKLELDVYNEELRIAVEYNGRQHYEYTPFFHKSQRDFHNQVYRDRIKKRLCKENNIHLIIVKYDIPLENIPNYIKKKLPESSKIDGIFSPNNRH